MSISSKIQSLITAANTVTGESRTDLTACVQDLKDGYGGSSVTKGLVFSDYDSDGYPTKAEIKGFTTIPTKLMYLNSGCTMIKKIQSLTIPEGVTQIGGYAFSYWDKTEELNLPSTLTEYAFAGGREFQGWTSLKSVTIPSGVTSVSNTTFGYCSNMKTVTFLGNTTNIGTNAFQNCSSVELYDFSAYTGSTIPSLSSVASLGHKSGCVIKVPQSLLSTWQNTTNWVGLQNVTWQGV